MITIRGLRFCYGRRCVLENVNADIPENGITFLMGPNGAGKTTLIKAMLGLERYSGSVQYDGLELREVRRQVGIVYEDAPCYRGLTGLQNLRVLANGSASWSELQELGAALFEHGKLGCKARSYSYGQRRKLAIVAALAGSPRYLLMDEVSTGLDYEAMLWLKATLLSLAPSTTILLTGHQFDFYADIVSRVLILKDRSIDAHLVSADIRENNVLGELYENAYRSTS
jgi:ABC-type multidrug transport system ATPase subunit